ncbi:unnamed protein product, partial [Musa acuminata subsp. burmannicoides]
MAVTKSAKPIPSALLLVALVLIISADMEVAAKPIVSCGPMPYCTDDKC